MEGTRIIIPLPKEEVLSTALNYANTWLHLAASLELGQTAKHWLLIHQQCNTNILSSAGLLWGSPHALASGSWGQYKLAGCQHFKAGRHYSLREGSSTRTFLQMNPVCCARIMPVLLDGCSWLWTTIVQSYFKFQEANEEKKILVFLIWDSDPSIQSVDIQIYGCQALYLSLTSDHLMPLVRIN